MQNEIDDIRRVLIVDDDLSVLHGLRRNLARCAPNWEVGYSEDAGDALLTAKLQPIDIVISDIRMPHMHGGALLKRFSANYPQTLRIAFSDKYDALTTYAISECSHKYIAKPCTAAQLYAFVEGSFAEHRQVVQMAKNSLDR